MIFSLMFGVMRALWDDVFDPRPGASTMREAPKPLPPYDGRFFAWYRTRNTRLGVSPVIVRDESVGQIVEYVGEKHVLAPAEYGDTFAELIERYPAPTVEE